MASVSTPELKVILCGEYGVGKSSIFRRFTNNSFVDMSNKSSLECRQSTLGLDYFTRSFEPHGLKPVRLQLWDTGGLERVASITTSYYKFSEAALLVFSLNSIDSFHSLTQHLLDILSYAEQAKIYLVGNKCDMLPHEVTDEDIQLFLDQFPKFSGMFKVSCKSNDGLDQMFEQVAEKLSSSSIRKSKMDVLHLRSAQATAEARRNELSSEEEDQYCCAK